MRILTVRQPWAWALIYGGKDIENRSRNIAGSYRGPVGIHAGVGPYVKFTPAGQALRDAHGTEVSTTLHYGAVIGVVDLENVVAPEHCPDADGATCSPWCIPGHHHLWVANPRPLRTPVPATGRLGLWTPDEQLLVAIEEQIR